MVILWGHGTVDYCRWTTAPQLVRRARAISVVPMGSHCTTHRGAVSKTLVVHGVIVRFRPLVVTDVRI